MNKRYMLSHSTSHIYRPEIDGLRAVAVLAVVVFHVGLVLPGGAIQHLSGGFVGVDVFFVISGYLITGIIRSRQLTGLFRIRDFYIRRLRRILPALTVMLLVTSILAPQYMFPTEMNDYGTSLIAAILSISNIYYWLTAGYFSGPAESKLLLHTWSLAVEEQFYLFWPLLLVFQARWNAAHIGRMLVSLSLLSFGISLISVAWWPDSAFYLVFSRTWELLLGAALTLPTCQRHLSRPLRELLVAIGLGCILAAIFLFTPRTPFPGAAALLPCGGAALVIYGGANGQTLTGRLLSLRPIVFIGLISYSLYLWHWPVLVLQKASSLLPGGDAGKLVKIEVLALSFTLAILSWWLVERPLRREFIRPSLVFALSSFIFAIVVVVGLFAKSGLESRLTPKQTRMAAYLDYGVTNADSAQCQLATWDKASSASLAGCLPDDKSRLTVLLFGDSHAHHLIPGLKAIYPKINLLQLTGSGCKPEGAGGRNGGMCGSLNNFAQNEIIPTRHPKLALLAGRWERLDLEGLGRFIEELKSQSVQVVLFGPITQYDQALPRLIINAERSQDPGLVARHRLNLDELEREMSDLARVHKVDYVSLLHALCLKSDCPVTLKNDIPMQFDYGHLTEDGSKQLISVLKQNNELSELDNLSGPVVKEP